jgi:hypothetical protein
MSAQQDAQSQKQASLPSAFDTESPVASTRSKLSQLVHESEPASQIPFPYTANLERWDGFWSEVLGSGDSRGLKVRSITSEESPVASTRSKLSQLVHESEPASQIPASQASEVIDLTFSPRESPEPSTSSRRSSGWTSRRARNVLFTL